MIDVHAHYMPRPLVERLQTDGARYGVSVIETEPACHALHFAYGLRLRPFFAKLIEEPAQRLASMAATGIDREILSTWTDMHAHALGVEQGVAWHRLLNESLAAFASATASTSRSWRPATCPTPRERPASWSTR